MKLYIWRHPKPVAAKGICLGQTDMTVDLRKLKRLANQIERFACVHKLPKVIWVSPLQRSLKVGEILAQRGFQLNMASELSELNFGAWDGQAWQHISKHEIDEWCDHFADFNFESGESLTQLFTRVEHWLKMRAHDDELILAVGHGGWINAAKMLVNHQPIPQLASDWQSAAAYGELSTLELMTITANK